MPAFAFDTTLERGPDGKPMLLVLALPTLTAPWLSVARSVMLCCPGVAGVHNML